MKKQLPILLFLALVPYLGYTQIYTHQAKTTSLGGGQTVGGSLDNFVVIGEPLVTSSTTGANLELRAGFIFTNTDELFLTPCPIPDNLAAAVTGQDATLMWSDVAADSYTVRYRVKGASGWEVVSPDPTSNTTDLTGLETGTTYQFRVKSNCVPFESDFSANAEFVTEGATACEVPADVVISSIGDNGATVSWTSNPSAVAYDVRYRIKGDSPWDVVQGITTETFDLTGLFPGTLYQVRVRSVCTADGSLKSLWSDTMDFLTTGTSLCQIPAGFNVVEEVTAGQATISWNASTGANTYELRYKVKNTQGYTFIETIDATPSVPITGLAGGITYVYSVRSICSSDGSLVSAFSDNEQFVLINGVTTCETPENIATTAVGDNSATINWDPVTSAIRYAYRYRVKGSSSWVNQETSTEASLIELYAGTTYQFRVRSICNADGSLASDYSSTFQFTTTGVAVCMQPDGLAVTSIADNSASVDWNATGGALEYEVRYKIKGTSGWSIEYTDLTFLSLTGLLPGTDYRLKIRAICTADRSLYSIFSNVEKFTTTGVSSMLMTEPIAQSMQVYPNPFNDRLIINYQIPEEGFVSVKVYSSVGKEVGTVYHGIEESGPVRYEFVAGNLPAGVYMIKAVTEGGIQLQRVVLQR